MPILNEEERGRPLCGRDLLDLYMYLNSFSEQIRAVERDIAVKNFAVFGAIMLAQTTFLGGKLSVAITAILS